MKHAVKAKGMNAIWLLALVASMVGVAPAQERYLQAAVDQDGVLRIATDTGQTVAPELEPALPNIGPPIGYDQIEIAADGRAVGWVALYPNCCTSYPIPLALVIYSDGVKRSYRGNGLPVWRWRFMAGGRQVAFRQETVHGGSGVHYELRDVRTGELIAEYQPPVGRDNRPRPNPELPGWAAAIDTR